MRPGASVLTQLRGFVLAVGLALSGLASAAVVIPAGSIFATVGASCPEGFVALENGAGRFLVGVGTLGAESYAVGDLGGSAFHTLTVGEMPAHSHTYDKAGWGGTVLVAGGPFTSFYHMHTATATTSTGGGAPHENRPPYLGVRWCQLADDFAGGGASTDLLYAALIVGCVVMFGLGWNSGDRA